MSNFRGPDNRQHRGGIRQQNPTRYPPSTHRPEPKVKKRWPPYARAVGNRRADPFGTWDLIEALEPFADIMEQDGNMPVALEIRSLRQQLKDAGYPDFPPKGGLAQPTSSFAPQEPQPIRMEA
jgi:hypothetical protein